MKFTTHICFNIYIFIYIDSSTGLEYKINKVFFQILRVIKTFLTSTSFWPLLSLPVSTINHMTLIALSIVTITLKHLNIKKHVGMLTSDNQPARNVHFNIVTNVKLCDWVYV